MTYKMLSEDKLSQAGQKNLQSTDIKLFYSNRSYGFEYKKKLHKNFNLDNFFRWEAAFVGYNSIFCWTLSDVRC